MTFVNRSELLPTEIGDIVRSEPFQKIVASGDVEQMRSELQASVRERNLPVVIKLIEPWDARHYRLVWQHDAGGAAHERMISKPEEKR